MPQLQEQVLEVVYGKWGSRYRDYLIQNDKVKYYTLLYSGELHEYITEIDLKADRLYEKTVRELLKKGKKETIENQAEEIVFDSIIKRG